MLDLHPTEWDRNDADTLFICDVDGTLLTDDGMLGDHTRETIRDIVTNRGINFTLCTARSYVRTKDIARDLRLKIPVIVDSGSCLVDPRNDSVLWAYTFDNESLSKLVTFIEESGVSPLVHSYLSKGRTRTMPAFNLLRAQSSTGTPQIVARVPVFMVTYDTRMLAGISATDLGFDISVRTTQDGRITEVRPSRTTKGTAARRLAELRDSARIVAFGDSLDDYSLLMAANEGYVVAKAPVKLKHAFQPIGSNNEDAVARWIALRLA